MNVEIHKIPLTPDELRTQQDEARAAALVAGFNDLAHAWFLEAFGHDDFLEPVDVVRKRLANQRYTRRAVWLALPAGTDPHAFDPARAIGSAGIHLPLEDNTHLVEADVLVRAESRGQGLGSALAAAIAEELRGSGRTTIGAWTPHPAVPAEHPEALAAKTGVGVIDRTDASAAWLLQRGFELEQAERYSVLELSEDRTAWLAEVAAMRAAAADVAGPDYDILQWSGITPEEFRERMAELHTRMSVDAPSAGFDYREEKWDAERVVHRDEQVIETGHVNAFTAVRHVPTGQLVAYTDLQWPASKPHAVYQEDTLVHGEHRGHRLGMLAKAANLEHLLAANPHAARIHTWNAEENRFMLDINEALGFRPAAVEGAWQKVVDPL
jgi:GNAT superfamily N-acetyltransferase